MERMGRRHLTEAEFTYIKELFRKYKKIEKVIKISGRSRSTLKFIQEAKSFNEYSKIRPGGELYKRQSEKKVVRKKEPIVKTVKAPVTPAKKEEVAKNYDGAILAQTSRLRVVLENINRALWFIIVLLVLILFAIFIVK